MLLRASNCNQLLPGRRVDITMTRVRRIRVLTPVQLSIAGRVHLC
jgi:hypothetical protein